MNEHPLPSDPSQGRAQNSDIIPPSVVESYFKEFSDKHRAFWPFALIAAAFIVIIGAQWLELRSAKEELTKALAAREKLVGEAKKIETSLEALAKDLLEFAEINHRARAVVDKFQIRQTPTAAAPAPEATPSVSTGS